MSGKKIKKTKVAKPAKGKSAKVAQKAKTKATAPKKVLAKKTVANKAVKSKLKVKKVAKSTKVKKTVKKATVKNTKLKIVSRNQKPTKVLKIIAKKESGKKIKKDAKPIKNKLIAKEGKLLETKKSKLVEGIELKKIKPEKTISKAKRGKKKKSDDDDEPAIDINDALLAEILETVKPKKKNTKERKQIRTFVNPMASLTVAKVVKDGKTATKEQKGKFVLEFVLGTSPAILYEFLTTPSGLSEWFSDDVNIHEGVFTFFWEGSEQKALLLDFKEDKFIRFRWMDKPEGTYFEFKIEVDELTGDVSLIVTDFADEGSDLETSRRLWDSQIHTLMHAIGSY